MNVLDSFGRLLLFVNLNQRNSCVASFYFFQSDEPDCTLLRLDTANGFA